MSAASDPRKFQSRLRPEGGERQLSSDDSARSPHVALVTQRSFVVVHGPIDARIATVAGAQEGRLARWQLLQAGASDWQIKRRCDRGVLISRLRGVYAYGHAEPTGHSEEIEALLTRGPSALVCGHRAAGVHGFRPVPSGVDLLVPESQGPGRRDGVRIHRSANPGRLAPVYVDGIPVVCAAYVLLEIAADLSTRQLEVALDEAFSIGRVNRDDVRRVVRANPHFPGVDVLRELLGKRLVSNRTGSWLQEQVLSVIRAAGLPDPEMDAGIGGGFTADMLWRRAGVAVECDSFQWHSKRAAWARDRRKDAHCAERGIALVRVIEEDLAANGPLKLAARLAALIAERSDQSPGPIG